MAQNTSGLKAILSTPSIYNLTQLIMGGNRIRQEFVDEFVRPELNFSILDVGCGTAEILTCLPPEVRYWGYDISEEYIKSAQYFYGNRGVFRVGLIDEECLCALPKFNIILLIGVIHHLDDEEVFGLFDLLKGALATGGRIVTMDPCFDRAQSLIARFLISLDRGCNVRNAEGYQKLIAPIFPSLKTATRHRTWIPYTHIIMECANDTL
jgi:SAM-dependent methyltransferase